MEYTSNPAGRASTAGGPLDLARTLLGATEGAPVDEGFPPNPAAQLNKGRVDVRPGASELDLSTLQQPPTIGERARRALLGALCLPLVPYWLLKIKLVRTGELGLVRSLKGNCRALAPGVHYLDVLLAQFQRANILDDVITFGPLTICRVLPGRLGRATINGAPVLLGPGVHLFNDPLWQFVAFSNMNDAVIEVGGTTFLITVQRGQLALVLADGQGHILGEGRHAINNPRFRFERFEDATAEYLRIGSKHRVLLAAGRIGLAWQDGKPLILEATGKPLCVDSATFKFERSVAATQLVIRHGAVKVVTVRQGYVGVSFRDGQLDVLPPGRHILDSASHAFAGFLPTGQQILPLSSVTSLTADNVPLEFDAVVAVVVQDAARAIVTLGGTAKQAEAAAAGDSEADFNSQDVFKAVASRAKLTLVRVIGNHRLNRGTGVDEHENVIQPGRGGVPQLDDGSLGPAPAETMAPAPSAGGDTDPQPTAPQGQGQGHSFKSTVRDEFLHDFAVSLLRECGVRVVDFSVEDVRISSPELAQAMARGAVARADLAKAGIEKQVKLTNSEADKQAEVLKAEGRAQATAILAEAEAQRVRVLDDALSAIRAPVSQHRELMLAAGEVLKAAHATLVFTPSPGDAAGMLATSGAMAALKAVGGGK